MRGNLRRNILLGIGGLGGLVAAIGVFTLIAVLQKELPPTRFGPGHSESLPPQQINTSFIPRRVQEHVMERNQTHPSGRMLVQYNCLEYECASDMVEKLTVIVRSYPSSVYLAPYPGMDAKIALAAPGRLLTLDSLDEARVREFVSDNLGR